MKNINKGNKCNGSNEYQKAIDFLEKGCNCGCSSRIPREQFAELRESFQALSKSEQDIFLMAQLRAMDGGLTSSSRRLKKKTRSNKRTFYHWDYNTLLCQETYLNMLGIGRTYFERKIIYTGPVLWLKYTGLPILEVSNFVAPMICMIFKEPLLI